MSMQQQGMEPQEPRDQSPKATPRRPSGNRAQGTHCINRATAASGPSGVPSNHNEPDRPHLNAPKRETKTSDDGRPTPLGIKGSSVGLREPPGPHPLTTPATPAAAESVNFAPSHTKALAIYNDHAPLTDIKGLVALGQGLKAEKIIQTNLPGYK